MTPLPGVRRPYARLVHQIGAPEVDALDGLPPPVALAEEEPGSIVPEPWQMAQGGKRAHHRRRRAVQSSAVRWRSKSAVERQGTRRLKALIG